MTVLPEPDVVVRPHTTPLNATRPQQQRAPAFSDARMGALQLRMMGLKAFGAFGDEYESPWL